jgi:hypothetical protein
MSPRFTPAIHLLPMLVLLAGVSGCPGHLDQIGWAEPDGGISASSRANEDQPGNTGGSTGGSGGGTAGTGGNRAGGSGGSGGSNVSGGTGGTGGTTAMTPAPVPPVRADGGTTPDASPPSTPRPSTDGGAAPDAGPTAPVPTPVCATATEIAEKILTPKCATCHGRNAPAAGLDLVTTGIKARLLNVAARGCAGKTLITATDQVGGHFFDKLAGGVAGCGGQMPFGAPPLTATEIKCLKDWIKPTP